METLRTSSYIIPVKLEIEEGKYMLIHGYTGAVDIVTEDLLTKINQISSSNSFSDEMLQNLLKRGYITAKTQDEENALVLKMIKAVHLYHKQGYKKFYILVNYDCNFRCPYCFENMISNKGQNWSHKIMTKEVVDAAFDSMMEIESNKEKHNKQIVLYGGEPLMESNLDIVKYIIHKGNSLGYSFSAITNGFDLDLYSDVLAENKIQEIQITLDGDSDFHNKRRFHYKKGGSFEKIMNNIQLALDKNIRVIVRSNIDSLNVESVQKLTSKFKKTGWITNPKFRFYPAMLKNNPNNILNTKHSKIISYVQSTDFESINDKFKNNIGAYSDLIFSALKNKKPLPLRPTFCGAQNGIYIFDPLYKIYCCLESVGIPQNIIGTYDQGVKWTDNFSLWKDRNTSTILPCNKCPYALMCGGGCAAKVMHINMRAPYCNKFPEILRANARRAYNQFINNY